MQSVIFASRAFLRVSFLISVFALLVGLFSVTLLTDTSHAAPGINQQINFQGRLLNSQGAAVPDGYYNLQFKVYQDGAGTTAGNSGGTLKWTENWQNQAGKGVQVKNGYMSVQLGSINPFGSQIDWNQDTLWLSINIGNTNTTCTPITSCGLDGEMLPMKRLSSTPFAMNSQMLGGLTSAGFIQNTTSLQTANIAVQSANAANVATLIQGATGQTADLLNARSGAGDLVASVSATGAVQLQNSVNSTSAFSVKNSAGASLLAADTTNMRLGIGTSAPTTTLHVETNSTQTDKMQLLVKQSGSGDAGIEMSTGSQSFYMGVDNSDGASFKITSSTASGSVNNAGNSTVYPNVDSSIRLAISYTKIVPSTTGIINSVSIYVSGTGVAPNNRGVAGVYNSQGTGGSSPFQLLGQSSEQSLTPNAWNAFALPSPVSVVAGQPYWLAYSANGGTNADNNPVYQTGAPIGSSCYFNRTYNSTLPASSTGCNASSVVYSYYAPVLSGGSSDILATSLMKVGASGQTTFRTSTDSTTALQVQNAAGSSVLNVDTVNSRIGIGNVAPSYALDVAGDINSSTQYRIGGQTTLTSSQLTFNAATSALITSGAAQTLAIQGGNATAGNTNGGSLTLSGGNGSGTGAKGLVIIGTPTFSTTTNDANCYTSGALVAASCTMTANSVNSSAAIIVGFSTSGQTATLPDPTITTAGRIIYVTAANGSSDFTLSVNGGGQGNSIAMRQNTTATMIWNGNDWTAAGASSSTTLQAAYDNTLQSAGGAELVVSKTSATNGLTIRDSATNSVNGTLLSVQTASAATVMSINGNVTEYVSNGGAESAGGSPTTFPASTWSALSGATVSRYNTAGNFIATGQGSASTATNTTAGSGIKNTLSSALTPKMTYNVSFATRLSSGTFTDMEVYYSADGTASSVLCTNAKASPTSVWNKVNCTFTAPSSGITAANSIFIRQASAGTARTFYVDNLSVTIAADYNYVTDGGVDDSTNFATNWSAVGSATVSRSTTVGNDASNSTQVVTTAANQGVRNKLAINPLSDNLYRVTAYVTSSASGFSTFTARYSRDGGTNFVPCADYNTQTVSSTLTNFTKITCYIKTDTTAPTNPYLYFTQTDATGRTFYVDTLSMTLSSNTTPNVQVGGGVNGGPTTLFTLDRGASAPIASDNDALLGSMYYDTSLGKLQCYEADGWGACGSSPDTIVTISPEYTNAVLHGTGIGTMTSDLCSDALNINDSTNGPAICGTNETYNFYKWTSPQSSAQSYAIYVTYQLPSTFKSFASGQTSIMGRTDSTNSTINYQIYRNTSSGLTSCGPSVAIATGAVSSWQTGLATGGSDPSTCSFAPGDSIVFKINMTASQNANAYAGNLNFTYSNR